MMNVPELQRWLHAGAQPGHRTTRWLSPRAFEEAAARSAADELSPREQEIMRLVLQGLTNKEIGENLSLRVGTIRQHVSSIMRKLRVRSKLEAVVHVMQTLD
jgi:DNA-binding NarL/FixJ family response regulator